MHAAEAADASRIEINHVTIPIDALWVLAPGTPQRASFKKDGGTNAVSIVSGETADIKHVSFDWIQSVSLQPAASRCSQAVL